MRVQAGMGSRMVDGRGPQEGSAAESVTFTSVAYTAAAAAGGARAPRYCCHGAWTLETRRSSRCRCLAQVFLCELQVCEFGVTMARIVCEPRE